MLVLVPLAQRTLIEEGPLFLGDALVPQVERAQLLIAACGNHIILFQREQMVDSIHHGVGRAALHSGGEDDALFYTQHLQTQLQPLFFFLCSRQLQ